LFTSNLSPQYFGKRPMPGGETGWCTSSGRPVLHHYLTVQNFPHDSS
jgi:hypothetical protein